jgi:hypothetical protein
MDRNVAQAVAKGFDAPAGMVQVRLFRRRSV